MAVNDIYQVQIHYNIGSELTMNVVHLKETVASTDDIPAETVATVVEAVWRARYATNLFSDESNVTVITARRIKPTAGIPSTLIIGGAAHPAIVGTGGSAPLPSTSACLISLYSTVLTKNGRGRIDIPGAASGTQNDGQLLAAFITLLTNFAEELEDVHVAVGPGTGEWRFGIYSRTLGTIQTVEQTIAHSNLASQRGRRNHPGIGV
jgi:hypothetical protein